MILSVIINFLYQFENWLFLNIFSFALPTLNALTNWVTGLSIPDTVFNIFSLTVCFLPMSLIRVLVGFTFSLVLIKIFFSVIHFVTLGILFKS